MPRRVVAAVLVALVCTVLPTHATADVLTDPVRLSVNGPARQLAAGTTVVLRVPKAGSRTLFAWDGARARVSYAGKHVFVNATSVVAEPGEPVKVAGESQWPRRALRPGESVLVRFATAARVQLSKPDSRSARLDGPAVKLDNSIAGREHRIRVRIIAGTWVSLQGYAPLSDDVSLRRANGSLVPPTAENLWPIKRTGTYAFHVRPDRARARLAQLKVRVRSAVELPELVIGVPRPISVREPDRVVVAPFSFPDPAGEARLVATGSTFPGTWLATIQARHVVGCSILAGSTCNEQTSAWINERRLVSDWIYRPPNLTRAWAVVLTPEATGTIELTVAFRAWGTRAD
jgi:hypothetical protein